MRHFEGFGLRHGLALFSGYLSRTWRWKSLNGGRLPHLPKMNIQYRAKIACEPPSFTVRCSLTRIPPRVLNVLIEVQTGGTALRRVISKIMYGRFARKGEALLKEEERLWKTMHRRSALARSATTRS